MYFLLKSAISRLLADWSKNGLHSFFDQSTIHCWIWNSKSRLSTDFSKKARVRLIDHSCTALSIPYNTTIGTLLSPMTSCDDTHVQKVTNNPEEQDELDDIDETLPIDPISNSVHRGKVTLVLAACSTPINTDSGKLAHVHRLGSPPLTKPQIGQFIHLMWPNNEQIWSEVRIVRYQPSTNMFDVLYPCHTGPYIETVELDRRRWHRTFDPQTIICTNGLTP